MVWRRPAHTKPDLYRLTLPRITQATRFLYLVLEESLLVKHCVSCDNTQFTNWITKFRSMILYQSSSLHYSIPLASFLYYRTTYHFFSKTFISRADSHKYRGQWRYIYQCSWVGNTNVVRLFAEIRMLEFHNRRICTSSCLVAAYRKTSVMRAVFVHDGRQDHGLTYLEQLWKYMDSNTNESVWYVSPGRRSFLTESRLIALCYVTSNGYLYRYHVSVQWLSLQPVLP